MKTFRLNFITEIDADIISFLERIPRPYRGEGVKLAIRSYMSQVVVSGDIKPPLKQTKNTQDPFG